MWSGDHKTVTSIPTLMYNHIDSDVSASSVDRYQFVNSKGSDSTDAASRKRKVEVVDQDLSTSMLTDSFQPQLAIPNSRDIASSLITNPQFDKPQVDHSSRSGLHTSQNSQFIPSGCSSQSGGYQETTDMYASAISRIPDNEDQNSNVVPPAPPTLQSKDLSPIGVPAVVEIPRLPFSQHFTYNVATHVESKAFQPCLSELNDVPEVEQVEVRPVLKRARRGHVMDVKDSTNAYSCQTYSTGAFAAPEGETFELVKNEIRSSSNMPKCMSLHVPQDHVLVNKGHNARAEESFLESGSTAAISMRSLEVVEMTGSGGGSLAHSEKPSEGIGYNLIKNSVQQSGNQPSPLVDESKRTTRNANSPTARKLWGGTLQLSTSTTVSAVAFFRSGERASEIKWSQDIEVKGKVRLEAFERYIQELPRSRSRALMVISLCWNAGSSKTGLGCMKEIAKVYKEGQRVGYAQLHPGTDLYVCPRSDTIITILAKHGFFKGMVAVEEDQDSLIGCVVWRRNLATSHAKVMESKKSLKTKSSDSPTKESDRQGEHISKVAFSNESKISQSIERYEDNTSEPSPTLPVVLNVPENRIIPMLNSSIDLVVDSMKNNNMNSVFTATEIPVKFDDATFSPIVSPARILTYTSASTNPCSDANAPQPLLKVVENCQEAKLNSSDDDDLPEFDFVAACSAPSMPNGEFSRSTEQASLAVIQSSEKLNVEQGDSLSEASKTSEKILSFKMSHFPSTLPVLDLGSIQGKVAGQTAEVLKTKNDDSATQDFNYHNRQKKIWDDSDDDDDMPEWCPPEIDMGNLSSPPLKLSHPSFYPPRNQPLPLPLGLPPMSQLQQHQQSSEDYRERMALPPPEPPRLTDYHLPSGYRLSWQPPATSEHPSSIEDHRGHQTSTHIRQSSKDSPSRSPLRPNRFDLMQKHLSPSCQNRSHLSPKHENMSPFGRKYTQDHWDWRNSRDLSRRLPGNQHGRSPGKPDRYHYKHQDERPRGCYTDWNEQLERESFSPRHKPNESSRRRPTGFDILPNSPRRARDQYPRRRPSLFDVEPRDRSNHSSW